LLSLTSVNGAGDVTPFIEHPAEPFTFEPTPGGAVYLLKVPRFADRRRFRRAVIEAGGEQHGLLDMLQECAAAILRCLPGDDLEPQRAPLLAAVAAYRADLDAYFARHRNGELNWLGDRALALQAWQDANRNEAAADEAAGVARRHDPAYRRLVADNVTYAEAVGEVAARQFLVGWQNVPAPFERGPTGVPDHVLEVIPSLHLVGIGREIMKRLEPDEARLKNSASPSGGGTDPATLPTSPTPAATTH
jgi:hypothetical protein